MLGCHFKGFSTAVGLGRFRRLAFHTSMIPHDRRADESAGKKPSRDSEPTVALRASVQLANGTWNFLSRLIISSLICVRGLVRRS
jgi:hypothetical protein